MPLAKEYFKLMSMMTLVCLVLIQALFYGYREQIVSVFTEDEDVGDLADKCFFIIVLLFIPDCIQGSI